MFTSYIFDTTQFRSGFLFFVFLFLENFSSFFFFFVGLHDRHYSLLKHSGFFFVL